MYTQYSSNTLPYTMTYTNINNNNDDMPSVGSSPTMNTPYLDSSSIDTPYLDNNVSSPFFDTVADISPYLMYASFKNEFSNSYNSNGVRNNMNDQKDDVCIARYLDGHENNDIAKLTHDPIAKFNGDPTVLLIDKSKSPIINLNNNKSKSSPTIKLETVTEEDSDSLFPPLCSSEQSAANYSNINKKEFEDMSLDDILGIDTGSPLSDTMEEDNEMHGEEQKQQTQEPVREEPQQQTQQQSRKRKACSSSNNTTQSTTTTTNKKRRNTKAAKKNSTTATKEAKVYECPLCDHVSKRRYNLSTHIKTHDKSRIKEFDCPQCRKSFDRRHDRDRHLATVHRGERSYACDHCTTHFSRRDALNRHLIQKHEYDDEDFIE